MHLFSVPLQQKWLAAAYCCWARSPDLVINVAVRLSIQKPAWQSKPVVCISQAAVRDAAAEPTGEQQAVQGEQLNATLEQLQAGKEVRLSGTDLKMVQLAIFCCV